MNSSILANVNTYISLSKMHFRQDMRVFSIEKWFKYESYIKVKREFEKKYGKRSCPSREAVRKLRIKFSETGSKKIKKKVQKSLEIL